MTDDRDDEADPTDWLAGQFHPHGDIAKRQPPPVDPDFGGATEVLGAETLGIPDPTDESRAPTALDSLFGADQFIEPAEAPLVSRTTVLPRQTAPRESGDAPRSGITPTQKTLLWVAGVLVGVLALLALFLLGTRLSDAFGPAPALATPSPTPTPSTVPTAAPTGPVEPGDHRWDDLLGGECLEPYESAWAEQFTVVDCATPHTAQMVFRGAFPEPVGSGYPGFDELQSRINLLCTAPTVIDYAAAGAFPDIQMAATVPMDEEWAQGSRHFYCFATRASAEPLSVSIAVPQVAVPPAG
jgi:hypothetical protein